MHRFRFVRLFSGNRIAHGTILSVPFPVVTARWRSGHRATQVNFGLYLQTRKTLTNWLIG